MNGYSFTEGVRRSLARAREEAADLGHDHVACEHLLLALVKETEAITASVLSSFHIDPSAVEREVLRRVPRADVPGPRHENLPYTSRAKKVLELSMVAAHQLGHTYVGCEHLLLGLIKEGQSKAAESLAALGVTYDAALGEVVRLVGASPAQPDDAPPPKEPTVSMLDRFVDSAMHLKLRELGPLTGQLADTLDDVMALRSPEDVLLAVVSNDGGARHVLEVSGVDIASLREEIGQRTDHPRKALTQVRELLAAAKSEQQFFGDCAIATHHVLLAYLALRPAHGYRALNERHVTHASVRALAGRIFG